MKLNKYTNKISAGITAFTGILATDSLIKASRKVGKSKKDKPLRILAESGIATLGTLAWMIPAWKLWDRDDDDEIINMPQLINEVRRIAVNGLTKIVTDIGNCNYDAEDHLEILEDIKEGFGETLEITGVSEGINTLITLINNNHWHEAKDVADDLMYKISTQEIFIIDDDQLIDSQDDAATEYKVTPVEDLPKPAQPKSKQQVYEEYEEKFRNLKENVRNGIVSPVDAAETAMDLLDEAPDFIIEAFKDIDEQLADIAEQRAKKTETTEDKP